MIDILLVLLVFFMSISSTEVLQKTEGVSLPVAKDAKDASHDTKGGQTIVNILWTELNNTGVIKIDEKSFAQADQMIPVLQAGVQKSSAMRVLIRADKKVRYEVLKQVMIAAGKSGVGNVTFSVVDKYPGAAPAN